VKHIIIKSTKKVKAKLLETFKKYESMLKKLIVAAVWLLQQQQLVEISENFVRLTSDIITGRLAWTSCGRCWPRFSFTIAPLLCYLSGSCDCSGCCGWRGSYQNKDNCKM